MQHHRFKWTRSLVVLAAATHSQMLLSVSNLRSSDSEKTQNVFHLQDIVHFGEKSFSTYLHKFAKQDLKKSAPLSGSESQVIKLSFNELAKKSSKLMVAELFTGVGEKKGALEEKVAVVTILPNENKKAEKPKPQSKPSDLPTLSAPEELFSLESLVKSERVVEKTILASLGNGNSKSDSDLPADEDLPFVQDEEEKSSLTYKGIGDFFQLDLLKNELIEEAIVQFVDDRSNLDLKVNYPISGLNISMIGAKGMATSDERGRMLLRNIPLGSEVTLRVVDPEGRYLPTVQTLTVSPKLSQIILTRIPFFEALQTVTGFVQESQLASVCGVIEGIDEGGNKNREGISVEIDSPQFRGPFFLNRFGYIDPSMASTGVDGRFCFLNVSPGPSTFSFFRGEEHLRTMSVGLFSANHSELRVESSYEKSLSIGLVSKRPPTSKWESMQHNLMRLGLLMGLI